MQRAVLTVTACLSLIALLVLGATSFREGDSLSLTTLLGTEPPRDIAPFTPVQAKLLQLQWATYVDKSVRVVNSIDMPLVLVPADLPL